MPTIDVATTALSASEAGMLVVGVFAPGSGERTDPPEPSAGAQELAEEAGIDLAAELLSAGFEAGPGAALRVPTRGALPANALLAVGLGPRAEATLDHLRQAAAVAANASERIPSLGTSLHAALDGEDFADAVQAVAEGFALGSYRFADYRSDPTPFELRDVTLHVEASDERTARDALEVAAATTGAALLTRDLVNTPPQDKRPPALAERAVAEVANLPITARVLDEDALAAGGYGGILGVGQGSSAPPRLVELTYAPQGASRHVVLVGKGITFDTGGISLKPSTSMETMKTDMAGAATVLAVVRGAAQLGLDIRVTALLALAENMPSGTATRVSDVLTMKGGTTVEVINTDAEGRLVLGDALVHASELEPDAIVDVATLTGAASVVLGDRVGILMSSDDELADTLTEITTRCGEPHWRLPLATEHYGERVEGAIADLKNSAGREAGTIVAGLFLHRFVGDGIPWAHLDIAGIAWSTSDRGYIAKGATGAPARSLLAWLRGV